MVSAADYARVRYLGERVLTRSEAARILGISYGTARRLDRQLEQMARPLLVAFATLALCRDADALAKQIQEDTQHMISVIDILTGRA